MKSLLVIFFALLLCANVNAQLRKCTGADGKITYSDVACSINSTTGTIKNPNGNTLDTSGLRQQYQSQEKTAIQSPAECKFSFYSLGDEKGARLAANAKRECLSNNEAKKTGQEISLEHYNYWRDHHQIMATKRSSAKTINCMPNGFGGQRCN